jgi:hypothetical protein
MNEYQCIMAKYVCGCGEHEENRDKASIKIVDGKAIHDVKCPCDEYMALKDPKTGAPSFRSNRYGQVL